MSLPEACRRRIVTTHTGSLPRPDALSRLLLARMMRQPVDPATLRHATADAVAATVADQMAANIDIVSDGEQSKASFQIYATERLAGIEPFTPCAVERRTRETDSFPAFYRGRVHSGQQWPRWACSGPIHYVGTAALQQDLDNLKAALAGRDPLDVFVPSVSPSSCAGTMENRFYATDEEHVVAVAEAMRVEYEAIVAAGFQLQIDDPRLAMHYMLAPEETVEQSRDWARRRIEILNHALRNIPAARVRHHTCYGINMGPRASDMEMRFLADLIITIKADYYSFEAANPRHEHEWRVWEDVKLPEGKMLLPGVVTQASLLVEHPELVAQRIVRFAQVVGRERVIASTDCGFASTLAVNEPPEIEPEIVWAKLRSMTEGARLASSMLW